MRRCLLLVALCGVSSLFAGCGPECIPDEGLGPDVSWRSVYSYAKTGEPVKLQLQVSARNIIDGYTVHGKCEGEFEDMSGTVEIAPAGGSTVGGALAGGTFATEIPYTTEVDLRVDITQPERGMYMEHWQLPSVFTLAAVLTGSNVELSWTPPVGDHGDIAIDITDVQTNNTFFSKTVPDTGSLTVATTTFVHPGEYYITGTRSHPSAPYNTLRIGATYIHP